MFERAPRWLGNGSLPPLVRRYRVDPSHRRPGRTFPRPHSSMIAPSGACGGYPLNPTPGLAAVELDLPGLLQAGERFGGEVQVGGEFLLGNALGEVRMLANEAMHTSR